MKLIDETEAALKNQDISVQDVAPCIQWLIDIRDILRRDEHFQLADEIRAKLDEMDIALEDTPKGTVWKRRR